MNFIQTFFLALTTQSKKTKRTTNLMLSVGFFALSASIFLSIYWQLAHQINLFAHPSGAGSAVRVGVTLLSWHYDLSTSIQGLFVLMPWLLILGLMCLSTGIFFLTELLAKNFPRLGLETLPTEGYAWASASFGALLAGLLLQQFSYAIVPEFGISEHWHELGNYCVGGAAFVIAAAFTWVKGQKFFKG